MARVLGVDVGTVRVGLAISDPDGVVAQPLEVVEASVEAVSARCDELGVDEIVVGIPVRMNGEHGPEAQAAERFAEDLGVRTGLPVARWDERLSTKEASRSMRAGGADARRQRGVVDKVAAAVVLRSFLESRRDRT